MNKTFESVSKRLGKVGMQMVTPNTYMRYVLYHAITDVKAKEADYGMSGLKISLSLSLDELTYLYECVAELCKEDGEA